MEIEPIAYIYNDYREKFGIPRQPNKVNIISKIVFEKKFRHPAATREIEGFSHIWLIFDFSLSHRDKFSPTVRPPRLGGNKKVGVFASRSPFRPNSLGLSCVKLLRVEKEKEGTVLYVSGADLLNQTPIYDIKPYIPYSDAKPRAKKGYTEINREYSLSVVFDCYCSFLKGSEKKRIAEVLKEDPRPQYKKNSGEIFKFSYKNFDISFFCTEKEAHITKIERL